MAFGDLVAALAFALAVVSLPMLMDRRVDIITAIMTSLWVVRENPLPMLVLAILIAMLGFAGRRPGSSPWRSSSPCWDMPPSMPTVIWWELG